MDGPITPVVADYLTEGVRKAERGGHQAFLVELDTPGGLDTSMREIIRSFLGADVPVIVYVTPPGARAASAGALITFSAHVAAMTPGTTIGAATPVDLQGGEITDKVINDAAAFAESVAAQRDRNTDFAVDTVRKGRAVRRWSRFPIDTTLEAIDDVPGTRGSLDVMLQGTQAEGLTLREAAVRYATSELTPQIVGDAEHVADELERLFLNEGCDGFIITPGPLPSSAIDFVELVVPRLQRRGLFRTEYTGRTLRHTLGLSPI